MDRFGQRLQGRATIRPGGDVVGVAAGRVLRRGKCSRRAQTTPNPPVAGDPRADDIAAFRQQIEQMQQRLQAQQAQLDQQAIQFQQLQAQPPAAPATQPPPASPPQRRLRPRLRRRRRQPVPLIRRRPAPSRRESFFLSAERRPARAYPRAIVGGQYRMMYSAADYNYHPVSISDNQPSQAFINERLRTWLTVQTSDNVEAYVQAQMGNVLWGTNYDLPKTFAAPGTARRSGGRHAALRLPRLPRRLPGPHAGGHPGLAGLLLADAVQFRLGFQRRRTFLGAQIPGAWTTLR